MSEAHLRCNFISDRRGLGVELTEKQTFERVTHMAKLIKFREFLHRVVGILRNFTGPVSMFSAVMF